MAGIKQHYNGSYQSALNKITTLVDKFQKDLSEKYAEVSLETFRGLVETGVSEFSFSTQEEFIEMIADTDLSNFHFGFISFGIKAKLQGEDSYPMTALSGEFMVHENRLNLMLSNTDFASIGDAFRIFERIFSDHSLTQYDQDADREKINIQKADECVDILEDVPNLQARLKVALGDEKEVQDFLYPVLKSHFSDLVDEDYLAKVASSSSKPDFAVLSYELIIECKFLRKSGDYKDFKDQIASDLVGYFGKTSPYKRMIIFIYNSSNRPIPANYVADLEAINECVHKVIVSPGMRPGNE